MLGLKSSKILEHARNIQSLLFFKNLRTISFKIKEHAKNTRNLHFFIENDKPGFYRVIFFVFTAGLFMFFYP